MNTQRLSLSSNEKISLISNLHTMLTAGIPILETVDSLLEGSKGNQKKLLEVLRDDLTQGKHVYSAFSKFPSVFDKVTVNILKASEEAGTLDVTLEDLKETTKKEVEFLSQIKSALLYPIFISIVFFGVMILILTAVIPKISSVFSRLKVKLPLPTKILIFLSDFLLTHTILIVIGAIAIAFLLVFLYKRNKKFVTGVFFSLPLLSKLAQDIDLTRFSRSLALLLGAGIPITSALELTQDVVTQKKVEKAIIHSKDVVVSGKKLSEGFRDAKNIFPNIMIKITEAGEKSGSLDKAMQDISEHLDYQVSSNLKTTTTLLEPVLLVVVGVVIGGMMLSILAPIYSVIGQISPR